MAVLRYFRIFFRSLLPIQILLVTAFGFRYRQLSAFFAPDAAWRVKIAVLSTAVCSWIAALTLFFFTVDLDFVYRGNGEKFYFLAILALAVAAPLSAIFLLLAIRRPFRYAMRSLSSPMVGLPAFIQVEITRRRKKRRIFRIGWIGGSIFLLLIWIGGEAYVQYRLVQFKKQGYFHDLRLLFAAAPRTDVAAAAEFKRRLCALERPGTEFSDSRPLLEYHSYRFDHNPVWDAIAKKYHENFRSMDQFILSHEDFQCPVVFDTAQMSIEFEDYGGLLDIDRLHDFRIHHAAMREDWPLVHELFKCQLYLSGYFGRSPACDFGSAQWSAKRLCDFIARLIWNRQISQIDPPTLREWLDRLAAAEKQLTSSLPGTSKMYSGYYAPLIAGQSVSKLKANCFNREFFKNDSGLYAFLAWSLIHSPFGIHLRLAMLDKLDRLILRLGRDPSEWRDFTAVQSCVHSPHRALFDDFIELYEDDFGWWGKICADLRVARIGLAAELFRRRHGHFPPNSAALAPEFLDAVPHDPYTGMPIEIHYGEFRHLYRMLENRPVIIPFSGFRITVPLPNVRWIIVEDTGQDNLFRIPQIDCSLP
jgi:hypothetical protein